MDSGTKVLAEIASAIITIILVAGTGLLLAFPIKWTWNVTMPHILALPTITWSKAWCLYFLCGCLIKSTQTNNNKA